MTSLDALQPRHKSTTVRSEIPQRAPLWVKIAFQVVSVVAPSAAAAAAEWLFFRPHTARRQGAMQEARLLPIDIDGVTVETYAWGTGGRVVLLVHGWAGRASQMAPLGRALASEGYRAITFDLPAHGASGGETTSLPQVERVIRVLAEHAGTVHAIVGHSFGAIAAMLAVAEGLAVDRIVVIGAPATASHMADSFIEAIGSGERAKRQFLERLERRFGVEMWRQFSPTRLSQQIAADALIVHDVDDRVVPYTQALELWRAWPAAARMTTAGFGHNRILKQSDVLEDVVDFINDGERHAARYE